MPEGGGPKGEENLCPFQPLGKYEWPAMPTEETLRRLYRRALRILSNSGNEPFIAEDHLQQTTLKMLDEIVAPPACGPLLRELDMSLRDWVREPSPKSWVKPVILPPCDQNEIVATWARDNGHAVLQIPERATLSAGGPGQIPSLEGQGVLVIPKLEDWFTRHRDGLTAVRKLLAALERLERHCVVGCNSWAWAFLGRAAEAHLILPQGLMFQAFDAPRLSQWFSELAESERTEPVKFRLSGSGKDVLEKDDEGNLVNDFFERLAARSLGIPWVAWYLWRTALRSAQSEGDGADKAEASASGDSETFWIAELQEYVLPPGHEQASLLIMQALLIHGALSAEDLRSVLPGTGDVGIVPVLIRAGFLGRKDGRLQCLAAAYPAIRAALSDAGFPMDTL